MLSPNGTIAAAVEAGRRDLLGVSPSPGLDARVLAGHVLGMDASALIAYGENLMDAVKRRQLATLVARRKAGEPVAYIVGSKEFCRLRLAVDRRVLVPRPETEELVERIIKEWHGRAIDALDLGTGSGAIACALADAMPKAQVLATDISHDALEVARGNAKLHQIEKNIRFLESDLLEGLTSGFVADVIVSNPPYIADGEIAKLPKEVRDFEPVRALAAGEDGLKVIRRLVMTARRFLSSSGFMALEIGAGQRPAVEDIFVQQGWDVVEVVKDLQGHERVIVAQPKK